MALFWLQPLGTAGLASGSVVVVFVAGRFRRRPAALAAVAAAFFAAFAAIASRHHSVAYSLVLCAPLPVAGVFVVQVRRLRDAKENAESLLAQIEQNRDAEARAAVLAERQHLSREMHDVLAHSLAGLMLQLEGVRMLARSSPDDPRLPEAVERAHELARGGLSEARHAIGMLRDEELPSLAALDTLTGRFERHSGIPCSFTAAGTPRDVRADARLALYRVTQEALTNVIKHAHADRVEVRLTYGDDRVSLTVEDFGAGPSHAAGNGGYGLTGMRERAELLGGTLSAGVTGAGFRVELWVPA